MSRSVPIPIPLRGLNTINPNTPLEEGFARELTNLSLIDGRLKMRPFIAQKGNFTPQSGQIVWHDGGDFPGYAMMSTGNVYTLSTGALAGTIGGTVQTNITVVDHVGLRLLIGARQPRLFTIPWLTAWAFTTLGITATAITSACSYKGRLYVASGTTIEYSPVAAIAGPMSGSLNLQEFLNGQTILRILPLTVQPGNDTQNVFVVFGSGGKVLIYQGDYPASSTWNLVGSYDMPAPNSNISFSEVDGDIFVCTALYAYWVRDLFASGAQTAYVNSPSKPIENLWSAYAGASYAFYLPLEDVILCKAASAPAVDNPQSLAPLTSSLYEPYFAYSKKYQAWMLWLMPSILWPIRYTGASPQQWYGAGPGTTIYRIGNTNNRLVPFTQTRAVDSIGSTDYDIETSWKTPFISPFEGKVQKVVGVRPYWRNTISGYLHKIRAIFDYSDLNSNWGFYTQSSAPSQINPGNFAEGQIDEGAVSWNWYNNLSPLEGIGGGFSIQTTLKRKDGSSYLQAQDISAVTVYVNDGGDFI